MGARIERDVAIVGGGMVGMVAALALERAGFGVAVVDREAPEAMLADEHDGRASAIAWSSALLLRAIGVWPRIEDAAQPIRDIRVSDGPSRLHLHFDHRQAPRPDAAAPPPEAMGYIIENRALRAGLLDRLADASGISHVAPVELRPDDPLERDGAGVAVKLRDDREIRAALVVGADGRGSRIRQLAGIGTVGWRYGQTAIVCSAAHDRPHDGVAHERFLAAGPFALLPMVPGQGVAHRSSVVWTERSGHAPAMLALDDAAFGAAMTRRFGDTAGPLRLVGGRWSHPLGVMQATRYIDRRLALIGDAAHAIHPIAGQGLNLGIRDVAALVESLADAARLGLDPGDGAALARYQRWRRFETMVLIAATDGLNRLFATDARPIALLRDIGLAAVNGMPGLKRVFMSQAMGTLGDTPKLLRGLAP